MNFYKYQGTGNDFILIDNRSGQYNLNSRQIANLCDRHFGIGADGLMLLEKEEAYDFRMVYYNSDGNQSTMCGNGGRCIVQFAKNLGLISQSCVFIAVDGPHEAVIDGEMIHLKMQDVSQFQWIDDALVVNTGSPHYVVERNIDNPNFIQEALAIRNNALFIKEGINVNFIRKQESGAFQIRTYERGVENETRSCGTGVVAASIYYILKKSSDISEIEVETKGGVLRVRLQKKDMGFSDMWLIGPAQFVFSGEIDLSGLI